MGKYVNKSNSTISFSDKGKDYVLASEEVLELPDDNKYVKTLVDIGYLVAQKTKEKEKLT